MGSLFCNTHASCKCHPWHISFITLLLERVMICVITQKKIDLQVQIRSDSTHLTLEMFMLAKHSIPPSSLYFTGHTQTHRHRTARTHKEHGFIHKARLSRTKGTKFRGGNIFDVTSLKETEVQYFTTASLIHQREVNVKYHVSKFFFFNSYMNIDRNRGVWSINNLIISCYSCETNAAVKAQKCTD